MKPANAVNTSSPMAIFEPISRLFAFFKRHGFRATLRRSWVFVQRTFSNRMVLFYLDFPKVEASLGAILPQPLTAERIGSQAEMSPEDSETIVNFWNPRVTQRNMTERFGQGASLWLIRWEGRLAGYGWTMTGHTIEPHYHPLGANDVHMFDFLVFPEFRGRQINPALVHHILWQMSAEGRTRAYIEVREWNQPQLSSLGKTGFQFLGVARKLTVFGRTFVQWAGPQRELLSKGAKIPGKRTKDYGRPGRQVSS